MKVGAVGVGVGLRPSAKNKSSTWFRRTIKFTGSSNHYFESSCLQSLAAQYILALVYQHCTSSVHPNIIGAGRVWLARLFLLQEIYLFIQNVQVNYSENNSSTWFRRST